MLQTVKLELMNTSQIPEDAVDAAAKVYYEMHGGNWADVFPESQAGDRDDMRAALEAAAPHIMAAAVEVGRDRGAHIVPGSDGYAAGFHYALHLLAPDEDA